MNGLTRLDPFRELEEIHSRLSGYFDRPLLRREGKREDLAITEWEPIVDISEDDKNYCVKVELPEMKREDIKVNVENGVLSISGERKQEKEEKNKRFHRIERSYGSFMRSFSLPDDASADQVNAQYRDGLLTVNVAKSDKAKSRSKEITVS